MRQYLDLLTHVLEHGVDKSNRTGISTKSCFGYQMRFNLDEGFPLLTTKKVHLKSVIYELLWFINGSNNIGYLKDHGVSIWDEWADAHGNVGPIYGVQWRSWPKHDGSSIDQLKQVISTITNDPNSRRMIVTAWNPEYIDDMALPPCHLLFQFYVANGRLSCQLYQRSADLFLGVPFNIASYSLLTCMIAHITGLQPGEFVHTLGDVHIYSNHIDQVNTQLSRIPRPLPILSFRKSINCIDDFGYEDIIISNYNPCPAIKAEVAI